MIRVAIRAILVFAVIFFIILYAVDAFGTAIGGDAGGNMATIFFLLILVFAMLTALDFRPKLRWFKWVITWIVSIFIAKLFNPDVTDLSRPTGNFMVIYIITAIVFPLLVGFVRRMIENRRSRKE